MSSGDVARTMPQHEISLMNFERGVSETIAQHAISYFSVFALSTVADSKRGNVIQVQRGMIHSILNKCHIKKPKN